MEIRKPSRSLRGVMAALLAVCMLLSMTGCGEGDEHTHKYAEKIIKEATCVEVGTKTFTCACGDSYTEEIAALGHNYQNGTCSRCGDVEVITHLIGTGTGYAVSLSSDGKELNCYQISTDNLLYTTYITEKPASGYYEFREYNGTPYYTPAPSWGWYSIISSAISGRTVQLKTEIETLELELISENQYKVTKGVEWIPAGLVFTFGTDMCSFMGHHYYVQCIDDVTCTNCGHFKCAGLGHEYGEDGVCFRCFAAMRPND